MNHVINTLASEVDCWFRDHNVDRETHVMEWEEKFAEMLIQECITTIEDEDSYYGSWMANVIKRHFGIRDETEQGM